MSTMDPLSVSPIVALRNLTMSRRKLKEYRIVRRGRRGGCHVSIEIMRVVDDNIQDVALLFSAGASDVCAGSY